MNRSLLFILLAITIIAVPAGLLARKQPALLGNPQYGSDSSCFRHTNYGGVANYCSSNKSWIVPLTYDSTGSKTITVRIYKEYASGTMSCSYFSCSPTNSNCSGSATFNFNSSSAGFHSKPATVSVPSGYLGYVTCYMNGTSSPVEFNSVDYTK